MANEKKRTPLMRELNDEVLDGFTINQLRCRSCSGYGNCGYRCYFLDPDGNGVVSLCMSMKQQLQEERDGKSDGQTD